MFFVEDLLPPEQVAWYKESAPGVCDSPGGGELFTNSAEYYPLIADRVYQFHSHARDLPSVESRRRRN